MIDPQNLCGLIVTRVSVPRQVRKASGPFRDQVGLFQPFGFTLHSFEVSSQELLVRAACLPVSA